MASNYQRIRHKRSGVEGKRPTPDILSAGELSINYNSEEPGVFLTTSAETIAKVGPTAISPTAPNSQPPSGGYAFNSNGEQWFNDQDQVLRIFNESESEWQQILSPLASSSKDVITVSQNNDNATDALFNNGKIRPFKTIQRALLQVARETVQKDPTIVDPNYTVVISNGRYSVPNKGTTLGAPTVDISSVLYGDTTPALALNASTTITFTFSEEPAAFDLTKVEVDNGILTNLIQDPDFANIFRATFTRTSDIYYGDLVIESGSFTNLNGIEGLGASLNLASSTNQSSRVSLYEQGEEYEPVDTDYEAINVNEGLIIPKGVSIVGLNQRNVYITGNFNSKLKSARRSSRQLPTP